MKELSFEKMEEVNGGWLDACDWTGAVLGANVGWIWGAAIGGPVGAVAGFLISNVAAYAVSYLCHNR